MSRAAIATVRAPGWSQKLRDFFRFASFFFNPSRRRADVLYELVSTDNYLTQRTLFRNVGYWRNSPATLDDACEALAQLAGEAAALGPEDRLLDAGFGFGDQDMYWLEHFGPRSIVGINVTHCQLERATQRVAERGMSERISLQLAQATQLPFEAAAFDKVIALESAFHFHTREDFFREAFRVLRPGGRLVTLDIVPQANQSVSLFARVISAIGFHFWQICDANLYSRDVYADKLRKLGFTDVAVQTVYDDTMLPFARYSLAELEKPEVLKKLNPAIATMIWLPSRSMLNASWGLVKLDYILAIADKPL